MSLNAFITNSDNLEEQLSAEEFIKSLKKVESVDDNQKSSNSGGSSASGSSDKMQNAKGDDDKKRLMDKKLSTSDLLCKMRGRFQHRATEPVFHTLATGTPEAGVQQQQSSERGSEDSIRMPQIETMYLEDRPDSVPANIQRLHSKFLTKSNSHSNLYKL